MTLVLSCDPGLAHGGFALLDMSARRPRVVEAETVNTKPADGPFNARSGCHMRFMLARLERGRVELFAVEDQFRAQVAQQRRGQSSAAASRARDVQHVLETTARPYEVPVISIAPQTWRARLGLTRATDAQIKRFVRAACDGVPKVLSIHAAEAICIGIAGWRQLAVDSRRRR